MYLFPPPQKKLSYLALPALHLLNLSNNNWRRRPSGTSVSATALWIKQKNWMAFIGTSCPVLKFSLQNINWKPFGALFFYYYIKCLPRTLTPKMSFKIWCPAPNIAYLTPRVGSLSTYAKSLHSLSKKAVTHRGRVTPNSVTFPIKGLKKKGPKRFRPLWPGFLQTPGGLRTQNRSATKENPVSHPGAQG